ncbi:MAG TPA: pitrilysin family protein [Bryobacteraceae bacterium]|nr:pitrilysin family protein [Bryobacteraceae bacterium]
MAHRRVNSRNNNGRYKRIVIIAIVATVIAIPGFTATTAVPNENPLDHITASTTAFALENGMTFILISHSHLPAVYCVIYANVGSVDDPKGKTGLAHLIEHMAFKGTDTIGTKDYMSERRAMDTVDQSLTMLEQERRKGYDADPARLRELEKTFHRAQQRADTFVMPDEFINAYRDAGGTNIKATTNSDATIYTATVPFESIELWFLLESERFMKPVFRQFYKERSVVLEERRFRIENQPINLLLEELLGATYHAHPYRTPPGGYSDDIQHLTRSDAEEFYRLHYTAQNLVAAVVGDISLPTFRTLATKYFGRLPGGRSSPSPMSAEPPQHAVRRAVLDSNGSPILLMAYHKPALVDRDWAAFEILRTLLSDGESSRLQHSLVTEQKLATGIAVHLDIPGYKYPGLFIVLAYPAPGIENRRLEEAVRNQLNELCERDVSASELESAKRRTLTHWLEAIEEPNEIALTFARFQALTGDYRNFSALMSRLSTVTPGDLRRVAGMIFTRANMTVAEIARHSDNDNKSQIDRNRY